MAAASGRWVLESATVDGNEISSPMAEPFFLIIEPGAFSGNTGCNAFSAKVAESGSTISLSDVFSTDAGCSPEMVQFEMPFFAGLGRVTELRSQGGDLVLIGPAVELRFVAASS
jgi:heat shock protein HslJ